MCIEAKVAEKYYTNYHSERDWSHPWNKQYVDLVKTWGNCGEGHIMCSCPYWNEHDKVTSEDNKNSNHRITAIAAIDKILKEETLNEALTSTSSLIRERAKAYIQSRKESYADYHE